VEPVFWIVFGMIGAVVLWAIVGAALRPRLRLPEGSSSGPAPRVQRIVDDGFWFSSMGYPIGSRIRYRYMIDGTPMERTYVLDQDAAETFVYTGHAPVGLQVIAWQMGSGGSATTYGAVGGAATGIDWDDDWDDDIRSGGSTCSSASAGSRVPSGSSASSSSPADVGGAPLAAAAGAIIGASSGSGSDGSSCNSMDPPAY
jgi:hypothetical protein